MSIEFNHTLVHARDTWAAAGEVGWILGLAEPSAYGPFAVLKFDNGATLDYIEDTGGITAQHYAFLVGEDDSTRYGTDSRQSDDSGGPTHTNGGQERSTTRTAAAACTGRVRTVTGWRSSPARTAAEVDPLVPLSRPALCA